MHFNKHTTIRFKRNFDRFVDNPNFFSTFNLLVKPLNVFRIHTNATSTHPHAYAKIFVGSMNQIFSRTISQTHRVITERVFWACGHDWRQINPFSFVFFANRCWRRPSWVLALAAD
ncbi:Uncharacterised protein [Vibrio cholerae]|nr:Uncharacterised protein [Vibrio cholerae]